MKNRKKFGVVMLPTEKASLIHLHNGNVEVGQNKEEKLYLKEQEQEIAFKGNRIWQAQHLYILSDDIKEGDWVYDTKSLPQDAPIKKVDSVDETHLTILGCSTRFLKEYYKKIVATTDKSLGTGKKIIINGTKVDNTMPNYKTLPQLPESFIQAYIKAYNEGKPITEVDLEMELQDADEVYFENGGNLYNNHFHKYDSGKVTIKKEFYHLYSKIKTRPDNTVIIHPTRTYSEDDMRLAYAAGHLEKGLEGKTFNKWIENFKIQ